jgi:hypothetical protein
MTAKQAELSLVTIESTWFFQENVLSNVSKRNFALQVFISLLLHITGLITRHKSRTFYEIRISASIHSEQTVAWKPNPPGQKKKKYTF